MRETISRTDRLAFLLYRFFVANRGWLLTLASGFLIGRATNELSVPRASYVDILDRMFSITDRPTNILSWLALMTIIGVPICYRVLARYHRQRRYDSVFALLVQKHKNPAIAPYNTLGWGNSLSLQTCPDLHEGWMISELQLFHDTTVFVLPRRYEQAFEEYRRNYYDERRFFDDGDKIMLSRNPVAFSDSPTLVLNTQQTVYSKACFFRDEIAIMSSERDVLIRQATEGPINFAHMFSMELVLVTSDDKVLITKRSMKVTLYPGFWSCSAEEQFALKDLEDGRDRAILRWAERMLREEMGLSAETYDVDNVRVMSVLLDTAVLNVGLCTHVRLSIDSSELDRILSALPRTDYEFTEWLFLEHDKLLEELFHPTRSYHPTSGYRMLMALMRRYGEPRAAEEFFRLERARSKGAQRG